MTTDPDRKRAAEVALAAVCEAGRLCREVQAGIVPATLEKKDRSPVTVADFGSQALVCRALEAAFPDDPVIAEEDAAALREPDNRALLERVTAHVAARGVAADADAVCAWIDRGNALESSARFWTLDPIDGTKGFLRGQQYAVALALVVDGRLEVAALGCPNLGPSLDGPAGNGSILLAVRGGGCRQFPLDGNVPPRPLRVSERRDCCQIRVCESFEPDHASHDDTVRLARELGIAAPPARLDSQAKYAVVARGEAEAYLRLPRSETYVEKIWDHAAGALAVVEAGGRVTDIAGRDLDFGLGYRLIRNRGMIVTNGAVHDDLLAAVERLGLA